MITMKLTDKVEKILAGVEKEDPAKAKQMRELLDSVMCIRKNDRIMVMTAMVINFMLTAMMFTSGSGASIVALALILHFVLFYACTAMNRKEENKYFEQLKELGFPFETLKEGEE